MTNNNNPLIQKIREIIPLKIMDKEINIYYNNNISKSLNLSTNVNTYKYSHADL